MHLKALGSNLDLWGEVFMAKHKHLKVLTWVRLGGLLYSLSKGVAQFRTALGNLLIMKVAVSIDSPYNFYGSLDRNINTLAT